MPFNRVSYAMSFPFDFGSIAYHQIYNQIPRFEAQSQTVNKEVLLALAEIICNHGVQNDFAITLLHRHLSLRHQHALVCEVGSNELVCTEQPVGNKQLYPHAYRLDSPVAFPVEFCQTPMVAPSSTLLEDLLTVLQEKKLGDVFGLSVLHHPGKGIWTEYNLDNERGTIARRQESARADDAVKTEWRCYNECGEVGFTPTKDCYTPPSGGHKKKPAA